MKQYIKPQINITALAAKAILAALSTRTDNGSGSGYVPGGNAKPNSPFGGDPLSYHYNVWDD